MRDLGLARARLTGEEQRRADRQGHVHGVDQIGIGHIMPRPFLVRTDRIGNRPTLQRLTPLRSAIAWI